MTRVVKVGLVVAVILVVGYFLIRWFLKDAYFRPEDNPPGLYPEPSFITLPQNTQPTEISNE